MNKRIGWLLAMVLVPFATRAAAHSEFTMAQALHYRYAMQLTAAAHGDVIAWVCNIDGVRNVWLAHGPAFTPLQLTQYTEDDGQEITQLTFAPDGSRLVWVRGGDHDANWPAEGNLAPDPASATQQPEMTIWSAATSGGAPVEVAKGDAPAVSARGALAFIKDHQVWTAPAAGKGKAERLFFDRGHDEALAWSPDGSRLAFVSDRGDDALIGVFVGKGRLLAGLAPSTGKDGAPRW